VIDEPVEITMGEAAACLGVSRVKLRRMVHAGVFRARQNPRDLREKLLRLVDVERVARSSQVPVGRRSRRG
jgi:hypothetical protein